jgi:hypothetical protein
MVTQQTQDFVFSLLDASIEYNAKMLILLTILTYSFVLFCFTYWIQFKFPEWDENTKNFKISKVLLKRAFRWISGSILFIFPLMFLFAYRGAKLETLLNLIYGLYIAFFGGFALWGIMYFWDRVLEFTGVNKINTRKNGGTRK